MENNKRARLGGLDFLKFLTALGILFHHFQQMSGAQFDGINFFNGKFYFGNLVEMFFIISGYVTIISFRRKRELDKFGVYISKKYLRFFPLAFITTTIFTIFSWCYRALTGEWYEGLVIGFWKYMCSISLLHRGWGIDIGTAANNPTWYISVLIICYVLFYMAMKLSSKVSVPIEYFCAFLLFLGISIQTYNINLPIFNADTSRGMICFFWGIILYQIIDRISIRSVTLFSIISIILFVYLYSQQLEVMDNTYFLLIFLLYPSLITLFTVPRISINLFNRNAINFLGDISFGIFLWHPPVFYGIVLIRKLFNITFEWTYYTMFTFAIVVILIATISKKLIEEKWEKKLSKVEIFRQY